jgi:type I restriction enzyme M protein
LFLKIADEHTKLPINKSSIIPEEYNWENLISKDGTDLEIQYKNTLENLSKKDGLLGTIFRKSQNKIQDPAKLKRIIDLIDKETWSGLNVDIKGSIYEGLLEKNAEDTKSGAGQYFTPRSVIKAIVNIMKPKPKQTICDPACGTGGFFLVSHDYISNNYQLDKEEKKFLKYNTFKGWDIVDNTARLCAMNLYLHGIGGEDEIPIIVGDSLISDPNEHFNLVLTNPPFGKKSSISISNSAGKTTKDSLSYERDDFWATTKNKQLNFLQHVKTLLKINGKAGIVVPDNVLFEAGAGETIRKKLLSDFDVHTLLRLPKGIFYARGVKANVLFFDKKPASEKAWTEKLWVYDLRTNKHFTLKKNPLKYEDFEDFIKRFNPNNRYERIESERFKSFSYNELMERDNVNLDIFWLKDESIENIDNLPSPDLIAMDIIENLESALSHFNIIYSDLEE